MGIMDYTIGKGIVEIGGVDAGNAPSFAYQQEVSTKARMRVVNGVRMPAGTYIVERRGVLRIVLDSWSDWAVGLARDGADGIQVKITQTQDIGPKRVYTFANVNIKPAASIPAITDSWATLEFEAEVLADENGNFLSVGNA